MKPAKLHQYHGAKLDTASFRKSELPVNAAVRVIVSWAGASEEPTLSDKLRSDGMGDANTALSIRAVAPNASM